jgi:2-keto-4-pentenoate hydratase/2-oxohepta-3-ene-1,7-dioic acid hydratase in catechol pathway
MKIARLLLPEGTTCFAIAHDKSVYTRASGDPYQGLTDTGDRVQGKLLAPVEPADIMCIGLNYRKHAKEAGAEIPRFPVLFFKNTGAIQNPGGPIRLPRKLVSKKVDYEAELAVVIGKTCCNVSREHALEYVLGYSCANDVSARDWQRHAGGGQWCRGKTFSTFCPLGPVLVTDDEIIDPNNLAIKSILNGQTMQDWNTNDMIFDVPALIEYLSSSTVLVAGTVILTGTPHGVGFARKPPVWLTDGDEITIEIEGIGSLTNPVCEEMP